MPTITLTRSQREHIQALVDHYIDSRDEFAHLLNVLSVNILADKALMSFIHSTKSRTKDPDHLKDKLQRKLRTAIEERRAFSITVDNLFTKINDLAGFRILHLHTRPMEHIHLGLLALFERERYVLREKPFARTWDDESRTYLRQIGISTRASPSLYTSVHYVVNANSTQKLTCEIQVRTLMEEVWGEVDHAMNYPHPLKSVACTEQIKTLARVTSSATRLVDSIFRSYEDHVNTERLSQERRARKKEALR